MRVAVIIPCYNVSALVAGAVRSALDQDHPDMEIVAVDDGSTDGTADVLRELHRAHPHRFRWLPGERRGAGAARNAGMRATTGSLLQFLDADDVLLPGKVARQVQLMHDPHVAVVAGAYRNIHPDGSAHEVRPDVTDPWAALIATRAGTTSSDLWRRQAVEGVGAWREDLASSQDYELLFRLLCAGHGMVADIIVGTEVLKRETGSISRTAERENWLRYIELRRAVRDHLRAEDPGRHASRIAMADQYLFMAIRVLSQHDRSAAVDAYERLVPRGFIPEVGPATGRAYVRCFRWLGFRTAERIAALVARAGARRPR